MEATHDIETIKKLTDDELRRLANSAWYCESLELSWLCQQETVRRLQELKEA